MFGLTYGERAHGGKEAPGLGARGTPGWFRRRQRAARTDYQDAVRPNHRGGGVSHTRYQRGDVLQTSQSCAAGLLGRLRTEGSWPAAANCLTRSGSIRRTIGGPHRIAARIGSKGRASRTRARTAACRDARIDWSGKKNNSESAGGCEAPGQVKCTAAPATHNVGLPDTPTPDTVPRTLSRVTEHALKQESRRKQEYETRHLAVRFVEQHTPSCRAAAHYLYVSP